MSRGGQRSREKILEQAVKGVVSLQTVALHFRGRKIDDSRTYEKEKLKLS